MVEVALSGNLDFVPLDEVLRLLTRSEQQGAVNVQGERVQGRIFISKRGVGLATTADDQTLRAHLINSGYVDHDILTNVEAGEASLAPLTEEADGGIIGLLREMTIDSLFQLQSHGASFEVTEGTSSVYVSPNAFELEAVLEDARKRSDEWSEVSRVVADLNSLIRMNRDIGDRETVKISKSAWKLLSEMGSGASVYTLAGRLGTTEFWTAQVAADMAERGLLIIGGDAPVREEVTVTTVEPVQYHEPVQEDETAHHDEADQAEEDVEDDALDPVEVANADESWWQEPDSNQPAGVSEDSDWDHETEEIEEVAAVAEPEDEPEEKSRFFGQFAPKRDQTLDYQPVESTDEQTEDVDEIVDEIEESEDLVEAPVEEAEEVAAAEVFEDELPPLESGDEEEVEEDTEAFLEKVFSELESNGQPEQDEGHGLLRRRRLGSVLKELDED